MFKNLKYLTGKTFSNDGNHGDPKKWERDLINLQNQIFDFKGKIEIGAQEADISVTNAEKGLKGVVQLTDIQRSAVTAPFGSDQAAVKAAENYRKNLVKIEIR